MRFLPINPRLSRHGGATNVDLTRFETTLPPDAFTIKRRLAMAHVITAKVAAIALLAMSGAANSREVGWNGTWSGLWEGKMQSALTIENGKPIEYRMQGRARPVSNVKLERDTMSFDVNMNEATSTVVLRRSGSDMDAEFVSPGGTRHIGSFASLSALGSVRRDEIDPTVTGGIAPAPAPAPKVER